MPPSFSCIWAEGNQSEAVREFALRALLHAELGLEPTPRLRHLIDGLNGAYAPDLLAATGPGSFTTAVCLGLERSLPGIDGDAA
jgi:hypothetical protein